MKTIITSILASALFAFTAGAQSFNKLNVRHHGSDKIRFAGAAQQFGAPMEQDRPEDLNKFQSSSRAAGDTIWYDDFANLDNWTTGTTGAFGTADSLWEHTTTGPYGTFTSTFGTLESETSASGWLMFDSDGNGSANPTTGAPTGVEFDTYIQMTNSIDLSVQPIVAIVFQEYYTALQSQIYIEVSIDGISWTTIEVHGGLAPNENTDNPEFFYQDISSIAGGEATVWVRLRFEGFGYFWQVDDFAIVEGVGNDLAVSQVFHGDIVNDFLYSRIPVGQASEIVAGAVVKNVGGAEQTNLSLDWTVTLDGDTVASGTMAGSATLAVAATSDTTWINTGYTPAATGEIEISVEVSADLTDANTANNTGTAGFVVTDFVWGHDYEDEDYFELGYEATEPEGEDGFQMGADYFCQTAGESIYAVELPFGPNMTSPTAVNIHIYENGTTAGAVSTTSYNLQTSDLSSATTVKFITLVLANPVELIPGNLYTATVEIFAGDDGFIYGNFIDDNDNGQSLFLGSEGNWFTWLGLTTAIRLNTNPTVGIASENKDLSGISIYPNPSEGIVRIDMEVQDTYTIEVMNVLGELVQTTTASSNTYIDLNRFGTGLFLVRVSTETAAYTERVMVQ